jgi:hypothetical protein
MWLDQFASLCAHDEKQLTEEENQVITEHRPKMNRRMVQFLSWFDAQKAWNMYAPNVKLYVYHHISRYAMALHPSVSSPPGSASPSVTSTTSAISTTSHTSHTSPTSSIPTVAPSITSIQAADILLAIDWVDENGMIGKE